VQTVQINDTVATERKCPPDLSDPTVVDTDVERADTVGCDHTSSAKQQSHSSSAIALDFL
jgi:hypothetical protein